MTQNFAMTSCGEKKSRRLSRREPGRVTGRGSMRTEIRRWPGRGLPGAMLTGNGTRHNRRSVAETAMYRVKQLFGGHLTLRDYDAQVGEAMAMIRALNKITHAGMPESVRIA